MGSLRKLYPLSGAGYGALYADVRLSQALLRTRIQAFGVVHAAYVVRTSAFCSSGWSPNLIHRICWRIHKLLRVGSGIGIDGSNDVGSLRLHVEDGLREAGGEVGDLRERCDTSGILPESRGTRATLFARGEKA
jgi:hypothetical protein